MLFDMSGSKEIKREWAGFGVIELLDREL